MPCARKRLEDGEQKRKNINSIRNIVKIPRSLLVSLDGYIHIWHASQKWILHIWTFSDKTYACRCEGTRTRTHIHTFITNLCSSLGRRAINVIVFDLCANQCEEVGRHNRWHTGKTLTNFMRVLCDVMCGCVYARNVCFYIVFICMRRSFFFFG